MIWLSLWGTTYTRTQPCLKLYYEKFKCRFYLFYFSDVSESIFWLGIAALRFKIFCGSNLVLVVSPLYFVKSHSWTSNSAVIWGSCSFKSIIYNTNGLIVEDVVSFVPPWAEVYCVSFPVNDSVVSSKILESCRPA